jgi:hypothetical protein
VVKNRSEVRRLARFAQFEEASGLEVSVHFVIVFADALWVIGGSNNDFL